MAGESLLEQKYKEKKLDWLIDLAKKKSHPDAKPNAATYFYAGLAYIDKKDFTEAVTCFKRAIEIKPDYEDALRAYCWHINNETEQLQILERMHRFGYASADDLCLMGEIYFSHGFLQDAHYWFHEALKKEENNWSALTILAALHIKMAMIHLQAAENTSESDLSDRISDDSEIESILRIIYDKHIVKIKNTNQIDYEDYEDCDD